MFDPKKPTVQMLGRWQPWHDGHTALFKQAYKKTGQICIMVRDMELSEQNPFSFQQVRDNIVTALHSEGFKENYDYIIDSAPNIIDISYGRDVGYTVTQHDLGEKVHSISATKIRAEMKAEGKI